jgi:hypothetical protein
MPKASRNRQFSPRPNLTQRSSAVEILSSRPDDWKPKKDPESFDDGLSLRKDEIQLVLDATKELQEHLSRTRLRTAMNFIKFPEKEEKLLKQVWKQEKCAAVFNRRLSVMSVLKGQIEACDCIGRSGLIDERLMAELGCSVISRWLEEAQVELESDHEWDDDSSDDETDEEDAGGLTENHFGNRSESDGEGISEEIPEKQS